MLLQPIDQAFGLIELTVHAAVERAALAFDKAIYVRRNVVETVCTQMTKAYPFAGGGRGGDVVDLHVAVGDHHAVNEQLNELAALVEGGLGEPSLYPLAEVLH